MAFDNQTTRLPNGVTNAAPWQTMGAAGIPDPSWAHVFHNDFDTYAAGDWTVSLVGTGTAALAAVDGGQLLLTTTAGIADADYLQPVVASFKLLAATDTYFKFSGVLSDVMNCVFYAGLIAKSATPLAAADGVYIAKPTGAAALELRCVIGGVTTTVPFPATAIPVAATPFEIGFHIDYQGNVEVFFNPTTGMSFPAAAGSARGRVASVTGLALTQVLLCPSFGILNSTAAARTLGVDYVTAVRER